MATSTVLTLIAFLMLAIAFFCQKKSRNTSLVSSGDLNDYASRIVERSKRDPHYLPYN